MHNVTRCPVTRITKKWDYEALIPFDFILDDMIALAAWTLHSRTRMFSSNEALIRDNNTLHLPTRVLRNVQDTIMQIDARQREALSVRRNILSMFRFRDSDDAVTGEAQPTTLPSAIADEEHNHILSEHHCQRVTLIREILHPFTVHGALRGQSVHFIILWLVSVAPAEHGGIGCIWISDRNIFVIGSSPGDEFLLALRTSVALENALDDEMAIHLSHISFISVVNSLHTTTYDSLLHETQFAMLSSFVDAVSVHCPTPNMLSQCFIEGILREWSALYFLNSAPAEIPVSSAHPPVCSEGNIKAWIHYLVLNHSPLFSEDFSLPPETKGNANIIVRSGFQLYKTISTKLSTVFTSVLSALLTGSKTATWQQQQYSFLSVSKIVAYVQNAVNPNFSSHVPLLFMHNFTAPVEMWSVIMSVATDLSFDSHLVPFAQRVLSPLCTENLQYVNTCRDNWKRSAPATRLLWQTKQELTSFVMPMHIEAGIASHYVTVIVQRPSTTTGKPVVTVIDSLFSDSFSRSDNDKKWSSSLAQHLLRLLEDFFDLAPKRVTVQYRRWLRQHDGHQCGVFTSLTCLLCMAFPKIVQKLPILNAANDGMNEVDSNGAMLFRFLFVLLYKGFHSLTIAELLHINHTTMAGNSNPLRLTSAITSSARFRHDLARCALTKDHIVKSTLLCAPLSRRMNSSVGVFTYQNLTSYMTGPLKLVIQPSPVLASVAPPLQVRENNAVATATTSSPVPSPLDASCVIAAHDKAVHNGSECCSPVNATLSTELPDFVLEPTYESTVPNVSLQVPPRLVEEAHATTTNTEPLETVFPAAGLDIPSEHKQSSSANASDRHCVLQDETETFAPASGHDNNQNYHDPEESTGVSTYPSVPTTAHPPCRIGVYGESCGDRVFGAWPTPSAAPAVRQPNFADTTAFPLPEPRAERRKEGVKALLECGDFLTIEELREHVIGNEAGLQSGLTMYTSVDDIVSFIKQVQIIQGFKVIKGNTDHEQQTGTVICTSKHRTKSTVSTPCPFKIYVRRAPQEHSSDPPRMLLRADHPKHNHLPAQIFHNDVTGTDMLVVKVAMLNVKQAMLLGKWLHDGTYSAIMIEEMVKDVFKAYAERRDKAQAVPTMKLSVLLQRNFVVHVRKQYKEASHIPSLMSRIYDDIRGLCTDGTLQIQVLPDQDHPHALAALAACSTLMLKCIHKLGHAITIDSVVKVVEEDLHVGTYVARDENNVTQTLFVVLMKQDTKEMWKWAHERFLEMTGCRPRVVMVDQGSALLPQTIETFEVDTTTTFVAICQMHVKANLKNYFAGIAGIDEKALKKSLKKRFMNSWHAVLESYSEEGALCRIRNLQEWCAESHLQRLSKHLKDNIEPILPRLAHWKKRQFGIPSVSFTNQLVESYHSSLRKELSSYYLEHGRQAGPKTKVPVVDFLFLVLQHLPQKHHARSVNAHGMTRDRGLLSKYYKDFPMYGPAITEIANHFGDRVLKETVVSLKHALGLWAIGPLQTFETDQIRAVAEYALRNKDIAFTCSAFSTVLDLDKEFLSEISKPDVLVFGTCDRCYSVFPLSTDTDVNIVIDQDPQSLDWLQRMPEVGKFGVSAACNLLVYDTRTHRFICTCPGWFQGMPCCHFWAVYTQMGSRYSIPFNPYMIHMSYCMKPSEFYLGPDVNAIELRTIGLSEDAVLNVTGDSLSLMKRTCQDTFGPVVFKDAEDAMQAESRPSNPGATVGSQQAAYVPQAHMQSWLSDLQLSMGSSYDEAVARALVTRIWVQSQAVQVQRMSNPFMGHPAIFRVAEKAPEPVTPQRRRQKNKVASSQSPRPAQLSAMARSSPSSEEGKSTAPAPPLELGASDQATEAGSPKKKPRKRTAPKRLTPPPRPKPLNRTDATCKSSSPNPYDRRLLFKPRARGGTMTETEAQHAVTTPTAGGGFTPISILTKPGSSSPRSKSSHSTRVSWAAEDDVRSIPSSRRSNGNVLPDLSHATNKATASKKGLRRSRRAGSRNSASPASVHARRKRIQTDCEEPGSNVPTRTVPRYKRATMVSMSPIGSGGRLSSDGKEGCSSADDTDELDAGPAQWEHD